MGRTIKKLKRHFILSLIAVLTTNLYFATWFMASPGPFRGPVAEDLSFNGFFLMVNISLLGVCLMALAFPGIGAYLAAKGHGSGAQLTSKTTISVLSFTIFMGFGLWVKFRFVKDYDWDQSYFHTWEILSMAKFRALLLFFTFISILMFFISNLEERTGNIARLWKQSMGEILGPKVMSKGFVFIDLNDATTLAERLGSVRYADMLRDCFALLGELVAVTPLEVYQFVGDEAVITWNPKKGNEAFMALQLFFDFRAYLKENNVVFERKYGIRPGFKAALHYGEVVKSEIGTGRKHLVFHGDVLNTTSRLLGKCHGYASHCIISAEVLSLMDVKRGNFKATALGELVLKGKEENITAYGVCEVPQNGEYNEGKTESSRKDRRFHINPFIKTKTIFQL